MLNARNIFAHLLWRLRLACQALQVLMLLCRAHLASGDSLAASKALDGLELLSPGAAAAHAEGQTLFVEVRLAAGRVPECLRFLTSCFVDCLQAAGLLGAASGSGTDAAPSATAGREAVASFLSGLSRTLRHISDESLPAFQSAVSSFVWKATASGAAAPKALLALTQTLLAQEENQARPDTVHGCPSLSSTPGPAVQHVVSARCRPALRARFPACADCRLCASAWPSKPLPAMKCLPRCTAMSLR